jgi:hypothetical protein
MRSAPPMVPGCRTGTRARRSRIARGKATLRSSAPAPASIAAGGADVGEAAAEADDHAFDPAVAHQQVGADADHRHRHIAWFLFQELREIGDVRRLEQHVGRAADAEPGDGGQQRAFGQAAPDFGHAVDQAWFNVCHGRSHAPCPDLP